MIFFEITNLVNEAVDTLPSVNDVKNEERMELIAACERMKASLESPLEVVTRIIFGVNYLLLSCFPSLLASIMNTDMQMNTSDSFVSCRPIRNRDGTIQFHSPSQRKRGGRCTACCEHGRGCLAHQWVSNASVGRPISS